VGMPGLLTKAEANAAAATKKDNEKSDNIQWGEQGTACRNKPSVTGKRVGRQQRGEPSFEAETRTLDATPEWRGLDKRMRATSGNCANRTNLYGPPEHGKK